MTTVIVQKWEESERGWGCRPDGYSIHFSETDRKSYIDTYWKEMPKDSPDEYSRPHGTAYEATIASLTDAQLETMKVLHGLRLWDNAYPGDGGKDGWR